MKLTKIKLFYQKHKFNNLKSKLTNNNFICKIIKFKTNKFGDKSYDKEQNFNDNKPLTTKNNFRINTNSKSVTKLINNISPYEISATKLIENEGVENVSLKKEDDLYIRFISFIKDNSQGNRIPTAKELESFFDISERKRRSFMEKMEIENLIEKQGKIYKLI